MTESSPLNQSPLFRDTFGDVSDKAAKAKEELKNPSNPEVARAKHTLLSFYKDNKAGVDTALFIGGVLFLNKRMVTKAVAKAAKSGTFRMDFDAYIKDLDVWDQAQRAALEARWAAEDAAWAAKEIAEQGLNP